MKQRRRWMNGKLFCTFMVIINFCNMVSCRRNDHPWYRQLLMVLFMLYYCTLYLLQFLTLSLMFVTLKIFFDNLIQRILVSHDDNKVLMSLESISLLKRLFFTLYFGMIVSALILSVSLPIDRSIGQIRALSILMSVLMLMALLGISYALAVRGFFPPV